jgi:peptidoglycan-N-acetylglucosamine deacetylase
MWGKCVYRGPGRRRTLALTFDDGPSEGSLRLLEYLAAEGGIRATFFQCGKNVERHPRIAREIRDAGHEIGNHTYSHARLFPRIGRRLYWPTPALMAGEIARAQHTIQNETGVAPRLFRAPYGLRWWGLDAAQKQFDLLGVMWTVIGHDWEWPADRVARLVLRKAGPGGIVCLHDGRDVQVSPDVGEMLKAVRQIVPVLKGEGFTFETVSELLLPAAA